MDELLIEPCWALKCHKCNSRRIGDDDMIVKNCSWPSTLFSSSKAPFQVCNSQIEGDKDEQDRDEQEMKEREIFGSSSISKLRSE